MKRRNDREIAKTLSADLEQATETYLRIQRGELEFLKDVPSGLPLSDGQYQIAKQAQRVSMAFEAYQSALQRYRDFLDRGIVPEEPEDDSEAKG